MQHDPRQGALPSDPLSVAAEDSRTEDAVLAFVLAEHPAQLTVSELTLELSRGSNSFAESDAIECAVRDLVGSGLLHCNGEFVLPTRAALRFDRIAPTGQRD
jgi:hypothetical protein